MRGIKPTSIHVACIDYKKAFDSVENSAVVQALRNECVDESYLKILLDAYSDSIDTIFLYKESSKIPIEKGVR